MTALSFIDKDIEIAVCQAMQVPVFRLQRRQIDNVYHAHLQIGYVLTVDGWKRFHLGQKQQKFLVPAFSRITSRRKSPKTLGDSASAAPGC
jgi:hypothetical protein